MSNLFYEQLEKESKNITLENIARLCKSSEYCSNKCPLYDDAVNVGTCLFNYDPCDWDIKRIKEAIRKEKNNGNAIL